MPLQDDASMDRLGWEQAESISSLASRGHIHDFDENFSSRLTWITALLLNVRHLEAVVE